MARDFSDFLNELEKLPALGKLANMNCSFEHIAFKGDKLLTIAHPKILDLRFSITLSSLIADNFTDRNYGLDFIAFKRKAGLLKEYDLQYIHIRKASMQIKFHVKMPSCNQYDNMYQLFKHDDEDHITFGSDDFTKGTIECKFYTYIHNFITGSHRLSDEMGIKT